VPIAIKKGRERTGIKPTCLCGECEKCVTRVRVFRWREEQKKKKLEVEQKELENAR